MGRGGVPGWCVFVGMMLVDRVGCLLPQSHGHDEPHDLEELDEPDGVLLRGEGLDGARLPVGHREEGKEADGDARHERLDVNEEGDERDQHEHGTRHEHLLDGLPSLALEHQVEVEARDRLAAARRAVRVVGRAQEGMVILRPVDPARNPGLVRVRMKFERPKKASGGKSEGESEGEGRVSVSVSVSVRM